MELTQIIGATPEVVAQAEARRAFLLPLLQARANVQMTQIGGTRKVLLGKVDPHLQKMLAKIEGANSAKWWAALREDGDPRYVDYVLASAEAGLLKVNPEFFSDEAIAKRAQESQQAAIKGKFMGLPKLQGSEKQVAWAETLRDKFRTYCYEHGNDARFEQVALSEKAVKAKFWIDERNYFDLLFEGRV